MRSHRPSRSASVSYPEERMKVETVDALPDIGTKQVNLLIELLNEPFAFEGEDNYSM